jgi:hypothetical protein
MATVRRDHAAPGGGPPGARARRDAVVVVSDLAKAFRSRGDGGERDLAALKGISFEIRARECVGPVGESGSRKPRWPAASWRSRRRLPKRFALSPRGPRKPRRTRSCPRRSRPLRTLSHFGTPLVKRSVWNVEASWTRESCRVRWQCAAPIKCWQELDVSPPRRCRPAPPAVRARVGKGVDARGPPGAARRAAPGPSRRRGWSSTAGWPGSPSGPFAPGQDGRGLFHLPRDRAANMPNRVKWDDARRRSDRHHPRKRSRPARCRMRAQSRRTRDHLMTRRDDRF